MGSGGSRIFQGALTSKVGMKSYYFSEFFPKSRMKMKEIGPRGTHPLGPLMMGD